MNYGTHNYLDNLLSHFLPKNGICPILKPNSAVDTLVKTDKTIQRTVCKKPLQLLVPAYFSFLMFHLHCVFILSRSYLLKLITFSSLFSREQSAHCRFWILHF